MVAIGCKQTATSLPSEWPSFGERKCLDVSYYPHRLLACPVCVVVVVLVKWNLREHLFVRFPSFEKLKLAQF